MASWRRQRTLSTLFQHPLLIAIPLYVLLLSFGQLSGLRLYLLEPMAMADSGVEDESELSEIEILERENQRLRDEYTSAKANLELFRQAWSQLSDYNIALGENAPKPIPARIILRGDSSNSRHSLYINRGSNHGIFPGFPVTIGRTLVGRVKEVSRNVSLVLLITDPGVVVPVNIIAEKSKKPVSQDGSERTSRGLLRGNASARPRIARLNVEDIDLDSGVKEGMQVITNESSGQFPYGLLVGKVSEVKPRQAFLDVEIEIAGDVTLVDILMVIPHRRPSLDEVAQLLARDRHLDIVEKKE